LSANANGSILESLSANMANYPDRDPPKLIEAAAQISESGVPLEKLGEHFKALMAEKETLQREIDEKRAILDGVDGDVESRRKLLEGYAQMKADMRRYGIGPDDPKRFSNVLQVLQRGDYDCSKILSAFADIEDTKRLRQEVDHDRQNLEVRLEEVKDTLRFTEQLLQYGVGINEVLAFMLAVDEKADIESISRGAAAYKVI
jgi:chromosome segregation ATPase